MNNNNHNNRNRTKFYMFSNDGSYSQASFPEDENINITISNSQQPRTVGYLANFSDYASGESSGHDNISVADDNISVGTYCTGNTISTTYTTTGNVYGLLPIAIDTSSGCEGAFDQQKMKIAPFELSTKNNELMLYHMKEEDLKRSIIEIWIKTQAHDPQVRMLNSAWYNWVLLDLARRLNQLHYRSDGHKLVESIMLELCQRLFFDNHPERCTLEGTPLNQYPLFESKRRARLIRLAKKFGDAICGLSEFIDFMFVLNMTDDAFDTFYSDLQQSTWAIGDRIHLMAKLFTSKNPLGPFKPNIDPFNQGVEQFNFLNFHL